MSFIVIIYRSIVDEYLQSKYWDLPVTGQISGPVESCSVEDLSVISRQNMTRFNDTDSSSSSRSIEQLNSNITLSCLLLDGIENCSRLLGTEFQIFLIDVLYPLLEKVGSDNAHVARCALMCLRGIAEASGSNTVAELLRNNADYLVNSISLKLRHVERYREAPIVLQVALRHGDFTVLPLVNNLIIEVMTDYL